MAVFQNEGKTWHFKRYPETTNRSLRSWSAADELLLKEFNEYREQAEFTASELTIALYHDRFGFLSTVLHSWKPRSIVNYSSQDKAMRQNFSQNNLSIDESLRLTPLQKSEETFSLVLMKVPKSMELFELYLRHITLHAGDGGSQQVFAGFMTRHFTPQMLEISRRYFGSVEQSLAHKKARLLKLSKPLESAFNTAGAASPFDELRKEISWKLPEQLRQDGTDTLTLQQYYGVFSSGEVDEATNLLLSHLELDETKRAILDMGCGNGIIAKAVQMMKHTDDAEIHALDDDFLACESAKLNLGEAAMVHHYDGLDMFPSDFFDVIFTNPPAHFEHENNIEVSLSLFKQAAKKLKKGGTLWVVSSRHLNYGTHLKSWFTCTVKAQTPAFELLLCRKESTSPA
ncbi:MAG: methyltransferase [Candidatus Cyclonatronum sp.]|uniref:class I SAM-dependent methyltransferase n=1 Tax=Cyclonatronum sp. TaxID=3024185 RepID=UPI0025BCF82F|nr:methyltransferase [Cyclonatronum sp.]MCH8487801.1 methyltransferase [Cyclonatronum sp.]